MGKHFHSSQGCIWHHFPACFSLGEASPHVSAKTLPLSPLHCPSSDQSHLHNCLPKSFSQGTQPVQNQRRSAKWLGSTGKACTKLEKARITGNGILWSLSFLLNLSEHLKHFCQSEPVLHRVLVPGFVQKASKHCYMARSATWIPLVSPAG